MSEPQAELWNSDNSDVLPEFQFTYGHGLFRGSFTRNWEAKLFRSLGLGAANYAGPLQHAAIPFHPSGRWPALGSEAEIHLLLAYGGNAWSIFGPHQLFLRSQRWMEFNGKVGGLFALATQMHATSFYYDLFADGLKQTNVLAEGADLRIIPDTAIAAYLGADKIYEDKQTCCLSDTEVRDFIRQDLAIRMEAEHLDVVPRFPDGPASVEHVTHFVFRRSTRARSFLGIRLR